MAYETWETYDCTAAAPCPECWGRLRVGDIREGFEWDNDYLGTVVKCEDCNRSWDSRWIDQHEPDGSWPDGLWDHENLLIGWSDDGEYVNHPFGGIRFSRRTRPVGETS